MDHPNSEGIDAPVSVIDKNISGPRLEDGVALCLSGGGYRAMIFHLGALIRLNEIGLLQKLSRVSSVSGGSIPAAQLGVQWKSLKFENGIATNFTELVIDPVRALGGITIDVKAVLGSLVAPGVSASDYVASAYRKNLYQDATLQDLPDDRHGPRFVINATNVQSGALWRFSRPYMGDYKVGRVINPNVAIAKAVAASSAFPPVLSPSVIELNEPFFPEPTTTLQRPPFTTEVVLTDGGVYDNLGLETAWKRYKTILVSDGGGKMAPEPEPKHDWARHAYRINNIIDNQVRSLRKRQLIEAFTLGTDHNGAFWGIRSHLKDFPASITLDCPEPQTQELAETPTRLQSLTSQYQSRLINWGYAVCAAATESHFPGSTGVPIRFPYPNGV
jgi:NTE family protein